MTFDLCGIAENCENYSYCILKDNEEKNCYLKKSDGFKKITLDNFSRKLLGNCISGSTNGEIHQCCICIAQCMRKRRNYTHKANFVLPKPTQNN